MRQFNIPPQTLTDEQKQQARENIGIDNSSGESSASEVYQGTIVMQSSTYMLTMTIVTREQFNYTAMADIINFLGQNGFTSSTKLYPVIGVARTSMSASFINVRGLFMSGANMKAVYSDDSSPELTITLDTSASTSSVTTTCKNTGNWLYV